MLDPNIITRGAERAQLQQQQNMEALGALGGALGRMVLGRRVNQMQQLKPKERQEFANNSIFAPLLNKQLKADTAAELQAKREQEKHDADIFNTRAQAEERTATAFNKNQQGEGYKQDNAGKVGAAVQRAISHASLTGDKNAALRGLELGLSTGEIPQDIYNQARTTLSSLNSTQDIKNFALGMLDPKFSHQTADNAATVGATLEGQKVQKEIAEGRLEFDKSQASSLFTTQQQDIKDGKAKLEVINGVTYLDYGNGRGEIYVDKNGQPIKPVSSTKPESKTETIERKEKAQNFAAASRSAADGATLAASILKRYQTLNYNPVQFAAASRIPGSEAYNIARDTETLKSNIFLAKAGDMRGLGALTDSEGARLENSFGSLDPSQGNQFITNLGNIAQQFSGIAKNNANKTGLYMGRDGNIVQTTQKPAATAETKPPSPKGSTMSLSEVKQAAQQAGISTEQAVQQLRSQGVIIK